VQRRPAAALTRRQALALGAALLSSACQGPAPRPGRPEEAPPSAVALPARLLVRSLGVDARIAPVGSAPDGAIEAPGTADEVGWYERSARPGEAGNAVLIAHRQRSGQPGALAAADRLRVGDEMVVLTSARARYPYVVEEIRALPDGRPADELLGPSDEPRLTLLTVPGEPTRDPRPERLVVRARGRGDSA
jgi:hypothetical protein